MKKWLEIPVNKGIFAEYNDQNDIYGVCFHNKVNKYTSLRKVSSLLDNLLNLNADATKYEETALFISSSWSKWLQTMKMVDDLFAKNQNIVFNNLIIPSDSLREEQAEEHLTFKSHLNNSKLYQDFDSTIHPREYERHFKMLSTKGYQGVVLHNDIFSKGDIVLAHKFGLETIIMDIVFERHEIAVKKTGADNYIIGRKS